MREERGEEGTEDTLPSSAARRRRIPRERRGVGTVGCAFKCIHEINKTG
jgi:hypothetical protein